MSRRGAEGDEMDFLTRPTPEDADLAEFARSLRATLVIAPPEGQAADLVPRLAEEARIAHGQGATEARPAGSASGFRLKRVGQLALGFCLVPLVAAGLATAGVKLPGPAQSAFESVGIELPNQEDSEADTPDPSAPAGGAPGAAPGTTPGKAEPKANNGKAKGKAKAKSNGNGNGQGQAQGQAEAPGQSGSAGNSGSASPGNSGSAPGQSKSSGSGGSGGSAAAPATPPGQANQPASPGNSGSAPGQNK